MAQAARIRLLVAGRRRLITEALAEVLGARPVIQPVDGPVILGANPVGDHPQFRARLERDQPDVLLICYPALAEDLGPGGAAALRARCPRVRVIVVAHACDEPTVAACVQFGAVGCVGEDSSIEELISALEQVHAGGVLVHPRLLLELVRAPAARVRGSAQLQGGLTPRERDVLRALARGRSTGEVAGEMSVSAHTVRAHVKHIMAKLGARSKLEAVVSAIRAGLIDLAE